MKRAWFSKRVLGMALFAVTAFSCESVLAASYFVADTIAEDGILPADARAATNLVKSSVSERHGDSLVENEARASYVLQPRMMKLGDSYILTVEKSHGQETLFAAQAKISRVDQLDRAARSATTAAIEEPSAQEGAVAINPQPRYQPRPTVIYQVPVEDTTSATTIKREDTTIYADQPAITDRKVSYWTVGFGPAVSARLEDDSVMYSFMAGHTWDINPRAEMKVLAEANLSSGDEGARFFNIGTGANFFLPETTPDTAPFVTADIGYGMAEDASNDDADGFSVGLGAGFQFFRTTQTTMDVLVRYVRVLDEVDRGDSNPSVLGARLAVNF
jgi:hypothetical protein